MDNNKSPNAPDKRTLGEELFLVHLHRANGGADDHDVPPHARTKTIGEELYEIHLKRSQGVEPDYDLPKEPEEQDKPIKKNSPKRNNSGGGHTLSLRNRDVPPSP
jgi:hypothetical protein